MSILEKIAIVDLVMVVILLGGAFDGFTKGLSKEILTAVTTIISLLVASLFYIKIADLIVANSQLTGEIVYAASFFLCMVITYIVITLILVFLGQVVDFKFRPFVERFFGAVSGAVRMLILISAIVLVVSIWRNETIYEHVVTKSKIGTALSKGLRPVYEKVREKIPEPTPRTRPTGTDPAGTNAPGNLNTNQAPTGTNKAPVQAEIDIL